METRPLGRTATRVSAIGFGTMTFGAQTGEAEAHRMLDMARDAGITLFDTAENYPTPILAETQGRSEAILGSWIAARGVRSQVTVATKVTGPGNRAGDLNHIRGDGRRLDCANIRQAVEASLKRLRIDCIDLYQLHWSERLVSTIGRSRFSQLPADPMEVSIEATLAALGELVDEGKVRHIGLCNETPWGAMRYLASEGPRIVSIQNGYNLLDRQFEIGLAELAMREDVGLIAYSPLAAGLLTGKYGDTPAPIPGSRSSQSPGFVTRFTPNKLRATAAYVALAREHGLDPAAMALAFVRQRPFVASVLMAASNIAQLEANLSGLDITLPAELVKAIDAIHDDNPNPR